MDICAVRSNACGMKGQYDRWLPDQANEPEHCAHSEPISSFTGKGQQPEQISITSRGQIRANRMSLLCCVIVRNRFTALHD